MSVSDRSRHVFASYTTPFGDGVRKKTFFFYCTSHLCSKKKGVYCKPINCLCSVYLHNQSLHIKDQIAPFTIQRLAPLCLWQKKHWRGKHQFKHQKPGQPFFFFIKKNVYNYIKALASDDETISLQCRTCFLVNCLFTFKLVKIKWTM